MPMAKGIAQCKNQGIFVFSFSQWYPMCFMRKHGLGHFRKWNAHQMCEHFILVRPLYKRASRYTMTLGRGFYKPKNCTLDQPNIDTITDPIVRLDRHCSGWVHIYTMLDPCFFWGGEFSPLGEKEKSKCNSYKELLWKKSAKRHQIWREFFLKSPYLLRQWVEAAHQNSNILIFISFPLWRGPNSNEFLLWMINSKPSTLNPGYITKLKKRTHTPQQQPQTNKQKPVLDHSFQKMWILCSNKAPSLKD